MEAVVAATAAGDAISVLTLGDPVTWLNDDADESCRLLSSSADGLSDLRRFPQSIRHGRMYVSMLLLQSSDSSEDDSSQRHHRDPKKGVFGPPPSASKARISAP